MDMMKKKGSMKPDRAQVELMQGETPPCCK